MLSHRKILFPKQTANRWFTRRLRTDDDSTRELYLELVSPGFLDEEGNTNYDRISIIKQTWEETKVDTTFTKKEEKVDLDDIHVCKLYRFTLVDDGSFCSDRVDQEYVYQNFKDFQRLKGRRLYNFSNENAPLKIFRLNRVYEELDEEEPELEYDPKYKTLWETEVLDHTKNVPCARTGHSIAMSRHKECVYVIGGVTILADEKYRGQSKIPDESWFLYPLQDIWELYLPTGKWRKILNMRPLSDLASDWHLVREMSNFLFNFDAIEDYRNDVIYGCFQQIKQGDSPGTKPLTKIFWVNPFSGRYGERNVHTRGENVRRGILSRVRLYKNGFILDVPLEDGDGAEKFLFSTPRTYIYNKRHSPKEFRIDSKILSYCGFVKYVDSHALCQSKITRPSSSEERPNYV